jgi:serine/threonine-protein kinase
MAPEEFVRGTIIDERTTVYTLGRAAFVLLSRGDRGEELRHLWRSTDELFDVARAATRTDPAERYRSVGQFTEAWRDAAR